MITNDTVDSSSAEHWYTNGTRATGASARNVARWKLQSEAQ